MFEHLFGPFCLLYDDIYMRLCERRKDKSAEQMNILILSSLFGGSSEKYQTFFKFGRLQKIILNPALPAYLLSFFPQWHASLKLPLSGSAMDFNLIVKCK